MKLKIQYLGGIEDQEKGISLTGSSTLFELIDNTGKKIVSVLVDAGNFQGSKKENKLNKQLDIEDIENLDFIILTHAHLDHAGRIPYLVKKGFKGAIYMTEETFQLAKLNWFDSLNISQEDKKKGEHFRKKLRDYLTAYKIYEKLKNKHLKKYERNKLNKILDKLLQDHGKSINEIKNELEKYNIKSEQDIENIRKNGFLYEEEDIYRTIQLVKIINYKKTENIHNFLDIILYNAAHIEGSSIPVLTFKNENGKIYKCAIAQDLGRYKNNPLEEKIDIPNNLKIDYLQLETTYAGRKHPELQESINKLVEEIKSHNGPILIPAFAIQRTQYIIKVLLENLEKFPSKKIYLTSILANKVKEVFLENKFEKYKYLLDKRLKFLGQDDNLDKEKLKNAIIIGSSGMLQGGSIEKWLKLLVKKTDTKIIFVGYQGEGTRGREILEGKDFIVIDGQAIPVKCKTSIIGGFSSHADTADLLHFLTKFKKGNKKILLALTHGGDNRYYLERLINKTRKLRRKYKTIIPKLKEIIEIEF